MAEFKIGAKTYEIVDPDTFTWREWKTVKQMCGTLPAHFGAALAASDPDAWEAYILVCCRRVDPQIPEGALDDLVMGPEIIAVIESWNTPQEDEEIPPASAPTPEDAGSRSVGENEPSPNATTNGSGPSSSTPDSSPSEETTPGPAGHPLSNTPSV